MKQTKWFSILNVMLIIATVISMIRYDVIGGLELKGQTSLGFVLLGAVNLVYGLSARVKNRKFPMIMAAGLLLCMIGDIVLNLEFIPGTIIFGVGHLFYIAAYYCRSGFRKRDALLSAVIFAVSAALILFVPAFDFGSELMQKVCLAYALVISCMVGKAVSILVDERSSENVLTVIGSALFYFSDLMLVLYKFADAPKLADTLCLYTYFPAQCLLAYGVFLWIKKEVND